MLSKIKIYIPAFIKKLVGNSTLYWKYRHLVFGNSVWHGYANDY